LIIYSPVPAELIWQNQLQADYKLVDQVIGGIPVQVMVCKDGTARVERILSTNPQDYLKAELQPGQLIAFFSNPTASQEAE